MMTMIDDLSTLHAAALELAASGLCVFPVRAKSKLPCIDKWQERATTDEAEIGHWWQRWPNANIGVQLGPKSRIIDVECDTKEAEQILLKAFGNDVPVVPCYEGKRGKHRLFRFLDGQLPPAAVVKCAGIEFRTGDGGKGAYSLFPPSIHPDGMPYRWLIDFDEAPLIEFPAHALDWLKRHAEEGEQLDGARKSKRVRMSEITKGIGEGGRNDAAATLIGHLLSSLADPYDNAACNLQWRMVTAWNATNKPPLPLKELEAVFASILTRERQQVTDRSLDKVANIFRPSTFDAAYGPASDAGGDDSEPAQAPAVEEKSWKVVIIEAQPRLYKLFAPCWEGGLVLTSAEYCDPKAIRKAAVEQKGFFLPLTFEGAWLGSLPRGRAGPTTGQAAALLAEAQSETAPAELVREIVVAELLHQKLYERLRQHGEENLPDSGGMPTRLPDGSIAARFGRLWEDMARSNDAIKRSELIELLTKLGVVNRSFTVGSSRGHWKVFSAAALKALDRLLSL